MNILVAFALGTLFPWAVPLVLEYFVVIQYFIDKTVLLMEFQND